MRTLILFGLFCSLPTLAIERKISVNGECTAEVQPDRGSVVMVAENTSPDAKSAIRKATELHEKLRAQLKGSKIKGLELSNQEYSVQEVTAWENNKSVSKGFQCRIGTKAVTTELSSLGEIIAIAGDAGIRNTHSLVTFLSDVKAMEEKKKCLEIAGKNAREKAEHMVKSLGARLGEVITIQERGGYGGQPVPMAMESMTMARGMVADKMAAPTIEAGKQTIHHEVDVTFAIEP
jgi:hypothetical protein